MANCHPIDSDVPVRGTFKDTDNVLTTPSAYTLTHTDPSGNAATITAGSITAVSTGVLEALVPADEVGVWRYYWTVTVDSVDRTEPGVFCVTPKG